MTTARPRYGRRRFLALAGVVGVGTVAGVGIDHLVGTTDSPVPEPATGSKHSPGSGQRASGQLVSGRFASARRRTQVGWTLSTPPGWRGGDRVPLCLVLHGYHADHNDAFTTLGLQDAQAALARAASPRPMVLAAADGGDGYWHRRADGDDPPGMLMDEFLPRLRARGVVTDDRLVAFGWSMGGYGAILLAETYPGRISRVGAESPAIWPSYAASRNANPTAFDSADDWRAHDVVGHIAALGATARRVDCGLSDPFVPASRQLARLLSPGAVHLAPGAHDAAFWKVHAPDQLRFLAS